MKDWHWLMIGWSIGVATGYVFAQIRMLLKARRRDRVETAAFEKYFENREKNRFDL